MSNQHVSRMGMSILIFACILGIASLTTGSNRAAPEDQAATMTASEQSTAPSWIIEGALTEACTCDVPCTCNFGEGPSPHDYCYALYSYEIHKGRYNDVTLDGLHFGATDLKNGRTIFIDERANELQRGALRVIIARVILRVSPPNAEAKANEKAKDVRYVGIKQDYDSRRNRLEVNGIGEFSADYIMGLDKTHPVVVRNNTTWRIQDAIKAKTSLFRVKVGKNKIDTKNTNSNQGEFMYTDKMDFGAPVEWSCGVCASSGSHKGKSEIMCGM